jgi:Flp pilus assembly protein TadG
MPELPATPEHRDAAGRPSRLWLGAFRRNQDGATAIEFGIVIMPFLALLFAIVETALGFWSTQVLETAVANAARTIYTGQFQQANPDPATAASKFRDALCGTRAENNEKAMVLFNCQTAVHIDVRRFTPGTQPPNVSKEGALDPEAFGYQATGPNDIVLVRVAVELPVFVNILGSGNTSLTNGKRLIMATATFRNEPFAPPSPSP